MNSIETKIKVDSATLTSAHKNHYLRKICELALLIGIFFSTAVCANASEISVDNVVGQINYQRELRGLKPLRQDERLTKAAREKSQDMIDLDYFEHYHNGTTPWSYIYNSKYEYLYAGENLAMDFQTSEGMVRAWMSSPPHRKNILNPDYDDIGIGIVKGEFTDSKGTRDTQMVTNMFGKEKPAILRIFDAVLNRLKNIF